MIYKNPTRETGAIFKIHTSNNEETQTFFVNGVEVGSTNYDDHGSRGMRVAREMFKSVANQFDANVEVTEE